jgi:hypothetical protein
LTSALTESFFVDDFDLQIIQKLNDFIHKTLKEDGQTVMAERLAAEIQRKLKERSNARRGTMSVHTLLQLKVRKPPPMHDTAAKKCCIDHFIVRRFLRVDSLLLL